MYYWIGGSIAGKRTWQDHCNYFLWLETFFCQELQYFSRVISIYIYSIYAMQMYLWYHLILSLSLHHLCFVIISLMNFVNTSYLICRLTLVWFANICHIVDLILLSINTCDILVHCVTLFKFWISSEYFLDCLHSWIIGNLIPG